MSSERLLPVSVVIPVFNQVELTRRCLTSLLAHSQTVKQVIIVDNASQDGTPSVLQDFEKSFRGHGIEFQVITNPTNIGFGRAMNQGIRNATERFVVLANNDTWLMPKWDQALGKVLQEQKLDIVIPYFDESPFIADEWAMIRRAEKFTRRHHNRLRCHFSAILLGFSAEAIRQLAFDHGGVFDERFFVTGEDNDLKVRIEQAGLRYAQTGACWVWHRSQGTRKQSDLPKDYELEGRRLFHEKWGYDPILSEHTFWAKHLRRWRKIKDRLGWF